MIHEAVYTLRLRGPANGRDALDEAFGALEAEERIAGFIRAGIAAEDADEPGDEITVELVEFVATPEDADVVEDEEHVRILIEICASCDEPSCEDRVAPYVGAADDPEHVDD